VAAARIVVSWVAPRANGLDIDGYRLERRAVANDYDGAAVAFGLAVTLEGAGVTSYAVAGLVPGLQYEFRVAARCGAVRCKFQNTVGDVQCRSANAVFKYCIAASHCIVCPAFLLFQVLASCLIMHNISVCIMHDRYVCLC
jgi:hypothetical protein